MKGVRVSNVGAVLAALLIGRLSVGEPTVVQETVEITPAEMVRELASLRIENDGLLNRIRGRSEIQPTTVYVTDTVVTPPDTVVQIVHLNGNEITTSVLFQVDDVWVPEIHTYQIQGNCDDGVSVGASLICDEARLGHLYPYVGLSLSMRAGEVPISPTVGVWWTPSYRSSWQISLESDVQRVTLGVRRGFRLF